MLKSWNSVNYCSNNDVDEASQNESEIPSKLQRNSYAVMGRCSKRKKLSNFFTVISVFVPFITSSRMESPHFYSQSDSTHCNLIFIVDNKSLFIWIVFRELFFFFCSIKMTWQYHDFQSVAILWLLLYINWILHNNCFWLLRSIHEADDCYRGSKPFPCEQVTVCKVNPNHSENANDQNFWCAHMPRKYEQ